MSLDPSTLQTDPEGAIRACIAAFVRTSPENRLSRLDNSPIYDEPLVAYASGDDPLFQQYKTIIGDYHLTPREIMQASLREGAAMPPTLSVIAWVLPIAQATRTSNREQRDGPSQRWAHTRTYGEQFNDALRSYVVEVLQAAGYLAVAPVLSPHFRIQYEGVEHAPASTWSERHILYAAGLGTFSLSDGFITPRGIAMRCGSVVTNLPLRPNLRPYANHTANCLYLAQGACGVCIERCPAGAIGPQGHDKSKCREYCYGTLKPRSQALGAAVVGCGLCQTAVPCEECIPEST